MRSGKCLQPSSDAPLDNGDLVVQRTCNNTVPAQIWTLTPIGSRTFISRLFFKVTHPAYRISNANSGLCLDDRDGTSSDGATVQQWDCSDTSTTMQWGGFSDTIGYNLIANVRASNNRSVLMSLEMAGGSTADDVPVLLFAADASPPPPAQEWIYVPVT